MNILVLGGSYFIGLAITRKLLGCGRVTLLNRGTKQTEIPGTGFIPCDRKDEKMLKERLVQDFDVVVDVSAYEPTDVRNVLDALKKPPQKYILVSSAAVYAKDGSPLPFREDSAVGGDPQWGNYGALKYECETVLMEHSGIKRFTIRPPYVYGPHNYLEREQFVWARLLGGKPIFVPGDGETLLQFCYVEDLADFVRLIVQSESVEEGVYNIGERSCYSLNDYIQILAGISRTTPRVQYVHDRDIHPRSYFPFRNSHFFMDVGKINRLPGYKETTLLDGMGQTYEWFTRFGSLEYRPTDAEQALLAE